MAKQHSLIALGNMELEIMHNAGIFVWRRGMPRTNDKALEYKAELQFVKTGELIDIIIIDQGGFKRRKLEELIEWLKVNDWLVWTTANNIKEVE